MSKNNTRAGSLLREDAGQIEFALSIFRDGQRLQTPDGQYNLDSFLRGFEIYESISSACMECTIILEDSGGVIGALTGSELFFLEIRTSVKIETIILDHTKLNLELELYKQMKHT